MELQEAQVKLAAAAEELGREICVFTNPAFFQASNEASASSNDETEDFYEFTPEDYYRIVSDRLGAQSQVLKTRKIREAEAAARRAKITKAVVRVLFPDNYILEAKFHPSEKIQDLVDLLMKVLAQPNLPFYLYTTPPKERIKDLSKDFYSAGFAPGAIVHFSYDLPQDSTVADTGPYLRDSIMSLNGLDIIHDEVQVRPEPDTVPVVISPIALESEPKPAVKKPAKPKWLKL
ncbi:plant UBX domain-containing protein 1 isoform X2 [Dioscorea cayenensis subsp. rotundata]|uniref:Plant UBX domain-containing protein 1 isoform X2 n=1 Tax=Dioscorea cayennensis subsp. rotundata TaxID=55577 RepID=A0AB40ARI9_DIOCR|nr:plant UBX domain-containing protein 1 isoform X2 [Dioscorea cayenensis subsp. rotundata]